MFIFLAFVAALVATVFLVVVPFAALSGFVQDGHHVWAAVVALGLGLMAFYVVSIGQQILTALQG